MASPAERFICETTGASSAHAVETVQELWSGYGSIMRFELTQSDEAVDGCQSSGKTVILKHVNPPPVPTHARSWASGASHTHQVEAEFYRLYAPQLSGIARVAALLRAECRGDDGERYLLLEDLDAAGYPRRVSHISSGEKHLHACLLWLARLHATFLTRAGVPPPGLWETGCYWHLATRGDELAAMPDGPLKSAAAAIDERLSQAAWTTVVHGDAKLANFCFAARGSSADDEGGVAAVDFQYAGGGCGVRDVAYLLGSGLGEGELERAAPRLLGEYFGALRAVAAPRATAAQLDEMEAEWRGLWDWAVADFQRFLAGWAPGHWKMNGYSARVAAAVARRCRKG